MSNHLYFFHDQLFKLNEKLYQSSGKLWVNIQKLSTECTKKLTWTFSITDCSFPEFQTHPCCENSFWILEWKQKASAIAQSTPRNVLFHMFLHSSTHFKGAIIAKAPKKQVASKTPPCSTNTNTWGRWSACIVYKHSIS